MSLERRFSVRLPARRAFEADNVGALSDLVAEAICGMSAKPAVVVYGNCQAEWVSLAMQSVSSITDRYDVHYLYSFDHPVAGKVQPDPGFSPVVPCCWSNEAHGIGSRGPRHCRRRSKR